MNLDVLVEPFKFSFMIRAFIGTGLIAVIAAVVGTFVVLKGLAFMGDAIAHTAFTGSAIALLLGLNLYAGAMALALVTALGVVFLTRVSPVKNDTALAILFTGVFAVGIIVLSAMPGFAGDLNSLLLGSVMAIQTEEIYLIAAAALAIAFLMWVFFPRFVLVSFDPVGAEAAGFPVTLVQSILLVGVAAAIVISIQAVGVVLVVALLITPAATGSLVTRRVLPLMMVAACVGLFSAAAGLYISYYLAAPPGATIVVVATSVFAFTLILTRLRSWLRRRQGD
ncbi:MAG: metal ABC transporter permease [Firmicutes bacterium]|jgi:manganese/iron transport system permease protein|nr:metal ABC transporter permease [Bacillota bacterium]